MMNKGSKYQHVMIPTEAFWDVKRASLELERDIQDIMAEAWAEWFQKHKHLIDNKIAI
jgi:hypothetical protein